MCTSKRFAYLGAHHTHSFEYVHKQDCVIQDHIIIICLFVKHITRPVFIELPMYPM